MSIPITTLSPSEISYIQTSLSDPIQPIRSDSRSSLDSREISISYGVYPHANGSSRLKIGNTEVIAGIKLDVVDSISTDKEKKGKESWRGRVEVDITPQAIPSASPSTLSSISTYYSSVVQNHFIHFLQPLVIIPKSKYFQPNIHLTLLSYDGNLLSSLALAARLAFSDLKIPKIKVIQWTGESSDPLAAGGEGGGEGVIGKGDLSGIKAAISSRKTKKGGRFITKGSEDWDLDLDSGLEFIKGREALPVLVTLNLVPNSENVFIDATSQEESACPSKLHLFFSSPSTSSPGSKDEQGEIKICGIRLEGGQSIDQSRIRSLLEKGQWIARELIRDLNENLPN